MIEELGVADAYSFGSGDAYAAARGAQYGKGHGDAVVAKGTQMGKQRFTRLDGKAIVLLVQADSRFAQIFASRFDSVAFLDAKFAGVADPGFSLCLPV